MSSIAKTMSLSTFNRSNVVVMLLVVGAVLGLFFLPEIIDLQRAVSGGGSSAVKNTTEAPPQFPSATEEEDTTAQPPTVLSPLEEVLMLVDSGREGRARAALPVTRGMLAEPSGDDETEMAPREGTAGVIDTLSQSPLTWQAIQSEASANALRRARKEALELSKVLGNESPNTRHALYNFASGLGLALDPKTSKFMKPDQVVGYLEQLDLSVSRTMARESVDRVDYLAWANISLGPVFEATRLGQRQRQYEMPFQPHLTLTSAYVMQRRPDMPNGTLPGRVRVVATGFVRGKDVRSLRIVGPNGELRARVSLVRRSADGNYRFFKTPSLDGRIDWTFIVESKTGEESVKTYRFFERAQRFPWGKFVGLPQTGYLLPFQNLIATVRTFDPRDVDHRLDHFFTVGDIEGRSSNEEFESF